MFKYFMSILVLYGFTQPLMAGQNKYIEQLKVLKNNLKEEVSECKAIDPSLTCDTVNKARQALSDARTKLQKELKGALKELNEKTKSSVVDLNDVATQTDLSKKLKEAKVKECSDIKASSEALLKKRLELQKSGVPADKKKIPLVDTGIAQAVVDKNNLSCNAQLAKSTKKPDNREPGYSTKNFFMQFGLATLAPYEIRKDSTTTPTSYFIDSDEGDIAVNPFIEMRYRRSLAWELARKGEALANTELGWRQNFWAPSDSDFRLGFTFEDNGDQSGSAVLGSSNLNARISLGLPIYVSKGDGGAIYTSGLRVLYESIADKSAQDAHNRTSIGVALKGGWLGAPLQLSTTKTLGKDIQRVYEYSFALSYNRMEKPNAANQVKNNFQLNVDKGFPDFEDANSIGLEGEFQIPFGENGYFLIDGGIFNRDVDPNPWYIRAGITVPLKGFFGIITSPFVETANQ